MRKRISWVICIGLIVLSVALAFGQARKSAVVTYDSDGPQGMYKFGSIYFKIDGRVKLFAWDSEPGSVTRFSGSNISKAYEKGAIWRIIYSSAIHNRDIDEADFHLWSATFTGRVSK